MRIYTKVGDAGQTLFGGKMVSKNDPRMDALGDLDELSSSIGAFKHEVEDVVDAEKMEDIQRKIYLASSAIANPKGKHANFSMDNTTALEKEIDCMTASLPPLREFILPGGAGGVALIHCARAVCRRMERQLISIDQIPSISAFVNRLSDYLFTLARFVLHKRGDRESFARVKLDASTPFFDNMPMATGPGGPNPSSPPRAEAGDFLAGTGPLSPDKLDFGADADSSKSECYNTRVVVKRDGAIVPFEESKILDAIHKCFRAVNLSADLPTLDDIIMRSILSELASCSRMHIESIQDVVEQVLMKHATPEVAKAYILYRKQRCESRENCHGYLVDKIPDDVVTPWGALGYVTFKRTYARDLPDGETESFRQTILRVLEACQTQLRVGFTNKELQEAYRYMMSLKGLVSGRFLWQLGTQTVNRLGMMSLQNCAFVRIDEPVRPFLWIFDALMLGTGVGCSIQRHHVSKLPKVRSAKTGHVQIVREDSKDADFIVPDKREGWVALLERVLTAFFVDGRSFSYSTMLIRGRGSPIKGFGGTASGPEDLCTGIENIVSILQKKEGERLTPVDCLDIICIIGSIVVAGNIRRSAILVMGDGDDDEFLRAKRWDLGGIPNWRAMSNNSVVCADASKLTDDFWAGYEGKGEPYGLINLELARACGRLSDGDKYPDPEAEGFNPCAEQSLCNFETCCLAEVFLPNIESYEQLQRVAVVLYRINKHSLRLPCHHPETEAIVHANMRMGIGMTGLLQATPEQQAWLPRLYTYLRSYDEQYSAAHGFPRSIKLTTVKPSGTLSLLAGVTPGVHPGIYKFFLRRIRISSKNPLVELCRAHGFHTELQFGFDGTPDPNTTVVSFPCRYPDHTILASQLTAIDQLKKVQEMQQEYSDNAVSCTVYYRMDELPKIKEWLAANYQFSLKGCSFLLHSEHGFKQAPYEEISEEEYLAMCASSTPIVDGNVAPEDDASMECAGGACPLK